MFKTYEEKPSHWLPCGAEINKHYEEIYEQYLKEKQKYRWKQKIGSKRNPEPQPPKLECCATVCPDKTPKEIDLCYKKHKARIISETGVNPMFFIEEKESYFNDRKRREKGCS